jgi:hypothetical protein
MKNIPITLVILALVTACARPEVVETRKVNDNQMTCDEIRSELEDARKFEEAARDERGVTGTNVAAALLFWPALLVTQANASEAIDAARERRDVLVELSDKKNCS